MFFQKCIVHLTKTHIIQQISLAKVIQISSKRLLSSRLQPNTFGTTPPPPINFKSFKKDKTIGPLGWFLLLIPVSTFCLGTWQVKRKKWKEELIESLMVKTRIPAISLPEDDSEVSNLEYRKVSVKGEFDHSLEMFLGPRSLLIDGESAYHGKILKTTPNKASGYLVVTPFILSDTKERILVNRGWIPFKQKNAGTRRSGQIIGEVELEGIVRLTEPHQAFGPPNKLDARIWFSRNVEDMAAFADCRPVFIDATAESTIDGGPIGGQTRAAIRNEHFSYILTWYGLSLGTSFMWYLKFIAK